MFMFGKELAAYRFNKVKDFILTVLTTSAFVGLFMFALVTFC